MILDVLSSLALEGALVTLDAVGTQIRYFLSSRPIDDQQLVKAIRRDWAIKNGLHWVRDVTFNEEQSRVGDRTAAIGWAILRTIALNLRKGNTEMRTSIRERCKRAGWDGGYMEQLLHGNLMR